MIYDVTLFRTSYFQLLVTESLRIHNNNNNNNNNKVHISG